MKAYDITIRFTLVDLREDHMPDALLKKLSLAAREMTDRIANESGLASSRPDTEMKARAQQ